MLLPISFLLFGVSVLFGVLGCYLAVSGANTDIRAVAALVSMFGTALFLGVSACFTLILSAGAMLEEKIDGLANTKK